MPLTQHSHRKYAILAEGVLRDPSAAKTAHGVMRYSRDEVVAVIDSDFAGKRVADVLPDLGRDAPIVASVADALRFGPTSLLIGSASAGGQLPSSYRWHVLGALDAGLEVVNGLHELVSADADFAKSASRSGAKIWDVRVPPAERRIFTGDVYSLAQVIVLAVGTDCSVGKMTAMLELQRTAGSSTSVELVATGQTGILIAGAGVPADCVVADFLAGAVEDEVLGRPRSAEIILVEGQGAIMHPAYAAVTFGLLYGCGADLLMLCHEVGREMLTGTTLPVPDLREVLRLHESMLRNVKPAPCVAIALNTAVLDEDSARRLIADVERETGVPTDDVVRFGAARLWSIILKEARSLHKAAPEGLLATRIPSA